MTAHFEEQLHTQRLRQSSQAQAEREAYDEGRRHEIARLDAELRESKAREEALASRCQAEKAEHEREVAAKTAAKMEAQCVADA